ncbi:hypothetical protein NMY22_g16582 [Coprinellus aureogranulatus]|nr:hypothetical protein NMY22_g16582 [Coprinellus aureogranulatus]
MTISTVAVLQILAIFAGTWFTWKFLKRLGTRDDLSRLAGPSPDSWITGSFLKLLDEDSWEYHDDLVKQYGKAFTFKELFGQNCLYVIDPKALYHIIVKDQMVYHRTEDFHRIAWWTLGTGLFTTEGEHHRKQRRILNPVFSAAHLRNITPLFYDVASQLRDGLKQQVTQGEAEVRLLRVDNDTELMVTEQVDMLNWMTRTALELIGRGALGYSFGTLNSNAGEHRYAKSIKNMIITMNDPLILGSRAILGDLTPYMGTRSFQRWAIEMLPWPKLREAKAMSDLIWNTSKEILENTKKCLAEGVESDTRRFGGRRDILSIFGGFPSGSPRNPRPMLSSRSIPVKANMDAAEEDKLPEDEIMGQVSSITFAGMDTTSNALSRILHLLSEKPDVQERLRDEIKGAVETHGEELDYSTLNSLPFLEAVVRDVQLRRFHASAADVCEQEGTFSRRHVIGRCPCRKGLTIGCAPVEYRVQYLVRQDAYGVKECTMSRDKPFALLFLLVQGLEAEANGLEFHFHVPEFSFDVAQLFQWALQELFDMHSLAVRRYVVRVEMDLEG